MSEIITCYGDREPSPVFPLGRYYRRDGTPEYDGLEFYLNCFDEEDTIIVWDEAKVITDEMWDKVLSGAI